MHNLTPEEIQFARLCFGKVNVVKPNLDEIRISDKLLAHVKIGSEIQFVAVSARSEAYKQKYVTEKGKEKTKDVIDVWGFDCGERTINASELRIIKW